MICISVTPTSRTLAKVDLLNASRQGDIIELCIDYLAKVPDFKDLIGELDKPVIISCRRKQEGGNWSGSEEDRLSLIRQAIVAGPDYIELDLDIAPQVPRFGNTKRVIAFTRLDRPEYDVDAIFEEAVTHQADIIKFRWPTPTLSDAWPLLAAVSQRRAIPIVGQGLSRGELTFSVLGKKYDSPWIYAALEKGMEDFPGQATIHELIDIYHLNHIDKKTKFIAVAGLGETETLKRFNEGFSKLGHNMRCLPVNIKKLDRLAKMFDLLKVKVLIANGQLGAHLVRFADHSKPEDLTTGIFDLFLKRADGWHGYNSLSRSLKKFMENNAGISTQSSALVIGLNSIAQSVVQQMQKMNIVVSVTGSDDKQAQKIAEQWQARHVRFQSLYDTHSDLVFLTDPDIQSGSGREQINPSYFRPGMNVVDLSNPPHEHPLAAEARERGCDMVSAKEIWEDQINAQFQSITAEPLPKQ